MNMKPSHNQAGFTLVELMVSLSLFIIVVLALVGSLFTVNEASRKVQAMRTVMDNISFATESISRTVRTSTDIVCGGGGYEITPNCPLSGIDPTGIGMQHAGLSMRSTLGEKEYVEFRWVVGSANSYEIQKRVTPIDDNGLIVWGNTGDWVAITSPEINIEKLAFFVDGSDPNDGKQPSVILKMEGTATVKDGTTIPFAIQTYLSQRTPENIQII